MDTRKSRNTSITRAGSNYHREVFWRVIVCLFCLYSDYQQDELQFTLMFDGDCLLHYLLSRNQATLTYRFDIVEEHFLSNDKHRSSSHWDGDPSIYTNQGAVPALPLLCMKLRAPILLYIENAVWILVHRMSSQDREHSVSRQWWLTPSCSYYRWTE